MPYRSKQQKLNDLQRTKALMALQAQGLVQACSRPGRAELRAGIKPFCVLKNLQIEPTRKVCPPCRNNSRRSKAYNSFLAKTGKDKIKREILEENIKILEINNKNLADTNKEQSLQIENLQQQLEECRSSLNEAMFCYGVEYESNQHYKNLI
jgi:hypothetical protein